jgi:hypothetical protein
MTTSVDFNMGETPFTPPVDPQGADWNTGDSDHGAHQEINDRRARLESAETLRLVRAL